MYRIALERLAQYGTSQLHEVSRYFYPPLYSSFLDPQRFAKASHSSFNAYSHTTCAAAAVQLHVDVLYLLFCTVAPSKGL